jgi:hypothetical protein
LDNRVLNAFTPAFGIQPGYDDSDVNEKFDPIIQRSRRDDSRVTLDPPQLSDVRDAHPGISSKAAR